MLSHTPRLSGHSLGNYPSSPPEFPGHTPPERDVHYRLNISIEKHKESPQSQLSTFELKWMPLLPCDPLLSHPMSNRALYGQLLEPKWLLLLLYIINYLIQNGHHSCCPAVLLSPNYTYTVKQDCIWSTVNRLSQNGHHSILVFPPIHISQQ